MERGAAGHLCDYFVIGLANGLFARGLAARILDPLLHDRAIAHECEARAELGLVERGLTGR